MTEIAISLRTASDQRSLTARIRVSWGTPGIHETQPPQLVESEIGDGPLLPDSRAVSYPSDTFIIDVERDFR